jgi:hypothetical protein
MQYGREAQVMLTFDPQKLRGSLAKLQPNERTAFAACCAIRQLGFLRELSVIRSDPSLFSLFYDALDFVAVSLSSPPQMEAKLKYYLEVCAQAAPTENIASLEGVEYAADASRQVIYTLQQLGAGTDDFLPAFFAAQVGYEIASDREQRKLEDGVITAEEEARILSGSIVQIELQEQQSDLTAVQLEKSGLGRLVRSQMTAFQ